MAAASRMTFPHRGKLALGLLAILVLAFSGCGLGSDDDEPEQVKPTPRQETAEPQEPPEGESVSEPVEIYFTAGEQFEPVERELMGASPSPGAAVEALLRGPKPGEIRGDTGARTQIPTDVELRGVTVGDTGKAVVKLSPEFTGGIPARPASRTRAQQSELDARLGQVLYTVSQFDEVDSARVISGGVTVDPDLTRSDYAEPRRGPKAYEKEPGARAAGARQVQERLAELGYLPADAVDGIFGYRTEQAVVAFQAWEGIGRDGIVGPMTRAKLATARRPRPARAGPPRRIEVHLDKGVALLVRKGRAFRAIHVSAGAPGTSTPTGTYSVFRK